MSIYPGGTWKPFRQNATASGLVPTQIIFHSSTSPDIDSTWAYFNSGSGGANTESHFIVGYDGRVLQGMDTLKRADAQWDGNAHAISIETASNAGATDPWAAAQFTALVALSKWLLTAHSGIGHNICRQWDDPGLGYHRQYVQWNYSGHSCPGNARVVQFPRLSAAILVTPAPPGVMEDDPMFMYLSHAGHAVLVSGGKACVLDAAAANFWSTRVPYDKPTVVQEAHYVAVYGTGA